MTSTTLTSENGMKLDAAALMVHADFLRRIALGLLGDESLADDAVQETWIKAMKSGPTSRSKIRGWLASVTRNEARQILRSESRRTAREESTSRREGLPSTSEIVERERIRREIIKTVMELPEHYRDVLLMRYYDDLPPREIARRLEVSVDTVQTRLRRGTDAMRSRLDRKHESREAWRSAIFPLAFPNGLRNATVAVSATAAAVAVSATAAAVGSKGTALGIALLALITAIVTWFVWPDAGLEKNRPPSRLAAQDESAATSREEPCCASQPLAEFGASTRHIVAPVATEAHRDLRFADAIRETMMLHDERSAHPADLRPPATPTRSLDGQHSTRP